MKITYTEGCTVTSLVLDNKSPYDYSEAELRKFCSDVIQSLHKDDYIELLQYMATQYGEMKFLYTCDQCYDNVYEWTLSTD